MGECVHTHTHTHTHTHNTQHTQHTQTHKRTQTHTPAPSCGSANADRLKSCAPKQPANTCPTCPKCQKRPIIEATETYYRGQRDLIWLPPKRRPANTCPTCQRECVVYWYSIRFIGTRFGNFYSAVDTACAAWLCVWCLCVWCLCHVSHVSDRSIHI